MSLQGTPALYLALGVALCNIGFDLVFGLQPFFKFLNLFLSVISAAKDNHDANEEADELGARLLCMAGSGGGRFVAGAFDGVEDEGLRDVCADATDL
jgi:hypothetical protein